MRILQTFRYAMRSKPAFDQLPAIIDDFLHIHGLTHQVFHYYLADLDLTEMFRATLDGTECQRCGAPQYACTRCRDEAARYLRKGTSCQRAIKDNPFLGNIYTQESKGFITQSLHNFDDNTNNSKEAIYGILTKIYRRYGFTETRLIYRDIDFFAQHTTSPAPEFTVPMHSYQGSSIAILRSGIPAGNAVVLTIASDDPSDLPDATIYAEALKQHLNCKQYLSTTDLVMSEQEKSLYENLNRQAIPLIQSAKEFFDSRITTPACIDNTASLSQLASQLKKICNHYGYTYRGYQYYVYFLEKKLPNGHYINLEFVSNPRYPCADPFVNLCGLGFNHQIWIGDFKPQNPQDIKNYLTEFFEALSEAENTVLPAILDLYPNTPDWFMPTH